MVVLYVDEGGRPVEISKFDTSHVIGETEAISVSGIFCSAPERCSVRFLETDVVGSTMNFSRSLDYTEAVGSLQMSSHGDDAVMSHQSSKIAKKKSNQSTRNVKKKRWIVRFDTNEPHRYTEEQVREKFGVDEVAAGMSVQHPVRGHGTVVDAFGDQQVPLTAASVVRKDSKLVADVDFVVGIAVVASLDGASIGQARPKRRFVGFKQVPAK